MKEKIHLNQYVKPKLNSSEPYLPISEHDELEQRIEELKQQLREKETKLKKYEILIRTNLNNVDGQYYNNPDNDELARDYEMKIAAKEIAFDQLQNDYDQEKSRINEVKHKLNMDNGYNINGVDLDELSSAHQRIKTLEEELEAQSKYSNNLISTLKEKCTDLENEITQGVGNGQSNSKRLNSYKKKQDYTNTGILKIIQYKIILKMR